MLHCANVPPAIQDALHKTGPMSRRLLITGKSGFVGSAVVSALIGSRKAFVIVPDECPDVRDGAAWDSFIAAVMPDVVIHLAALTFVPDSFATPKKTFEVNLLGTLNVLEALHRHGFAGRMLFVGTGDVYGAVPPELLPITEETLPHPRNPYAVSKLAAESLCFQWSQSHEFDVVMARPFNHIGRGQSPSFVIPSMARQIAEIAAGKRPPAVDVGDIDVMRDFTDVRDVVQGYFALIESGQRGEIYNVCSGREHTIRDVLIALGKMAGVEFEIRQDPARLRAAEQRRIVASNEKITRATGWAPETPFDDSLEDVLNEWTERVASNR